MKKIEERLSEELKISIKQVNNVIDLLDQGNTIPFIIYFLYL
ncbi:protein tex [Clostridium tetanomorphum DSM 665]|nr:protein tex [Clostridium tetanomorphum DSM 665]